MCGDQPLNRIVGDEDLVDFPVARLVELTKALTVILTLPQSAAERVDALVIATGQGEEWRLTQAIRAWETNPALRHLLVANGNPAEDTYVDISLDYLRGLGLRRFEGVCVQTEPAPSTGLQARWIADEVQARGISSLALIASGYHLPRLYLTVLKELIRSGVRVPLIPVPAQVSPSAAIPESGASTYDLVPGELKRILTYMDKGWVATPEELEHYLDWLWSHHETLLTESSQ
jgi:uncharacterized SAM-binding protein YcdF (DUF218 family)